MRRIIFLIYILMTTGVANAQDMCASYLGKTVALTTVEAAIAGLANLTPKGEFETTAQFKARRTAASRGVTSPLIIGKAPEGREHFKYDADAGVLRIITYAFDNRNFDFRSAFRSAGMSDKIDVNYSSIDVVISIIENVVGSYEASNAYGATVEVAEIQRKVNAIFDGKSDAYPSKLFLNIDEDTNVVGELALSPAEAQRLKPQLKLAFVVTPKEPYFATGSHQRDTPTVSMPYDVTEDFSVLVANIQCGLVMDSANNVLGAYATY